MDNDGQQFDSLLAWLDHDRERAARKYETIRAGIIRIAISRGIDDAEDLFDVVTNRIMAGFPGIQAKYPGDPAVCFHGFARNVIREWLRRKEITVDVMPPVWIPPEPVSDEELECLDACLGLLPPEKRELILSYYQYDGHDKIQHHKLMAKERGITENALRGRAHHLRVGLEECVKQRLRQLGITKPGQKSS